MVSSPLTRLSLVEGAALGCASAFAYLSTFSADADDVVPCLTFGAVVCALWLFVKLTSSKGSSPTYPSLPPQPPLPNAAAPEPAVAAAAAGNQVLATIAARRSIFPKDFNGKIISKEVIDQILEAGNWAPTHKLTEPWRFAVVASLAKDKLYDLTIEACRSKLPEDKAAAAVAKLQRKKEKDGVKISHFIAICMRRCPDEDKIPEWEEMCAVAAAAQNMMLAATALGVVGYWSSWQAAARDSPELAAFLGLDEHTRCLGFLVLGYSDHAEQYRGKRQPVKDKVKWKL